MEPLRCLLADIPQKVLADIVHTLTQQDQSIEVVGQMQGLDGVIDIIEQRAIEVLIVSMRKNTSQTLCSQIMEKFPDLLVVGLVDDGRMAVTYMGNVGKNDLLNVIHLKRGGRAKAAE
ncbi:MAG: hypothetical protein GY820_45725 [Gammaproteobacteria bacterium]|nr:hypothetical protein [Gammaproteobacteria bacterium]